MTDFVITADTPAALVPQELLDAALNVADSRYRDEERVDWEDVLDHLDGFELTDGATVDITTVTGPAVGAIKRYVTKARKES